MTYEEDMAGTTMEEKNASLRAAVLQRLGGCCEGAKVCSEECHPVLSDPEDESDDTEDPIHEFRGGWTADLPISNFATHQSTSRFLQLLDEIAEMHRSKSRDYGSEDDPLANIRHGADLVDIEPWRGCMVRIADKVCRESAPTARRGVSFMRVYATRCSISRLTACSRSFCTRRARMRDSEALAWLTEDDIARIAHRAASSKGAVVNDVRRLLDERLRLLVRIARLEEQRDHWRIRGD